MNATVTIAGRDGLRLGSRRRPRRLVRAAALVAAAGVLLTGCSGDSTTEVSPSVEVSTPAASPTGPTRTSPTPSAPPATGEPIEFRYVSSKSPCPPTLASDALPLTTRNEYVLDRGSSHRHTDPAPAYFLELCSYQRADRQKDEDLVVAERHIQFASQMQLYQRPSELHGRFADVLPLWSESLEDWAESIYHRREWDAFREGCGEPLRVCAEGEDPLVQVRAHQNSFSGHVGNLGFDVSVTYLAEHLPPYAEQRNIAIFRDFVLTIVESKERVE